jgi:5-methylcytosine-specific restriction endonuclease McrA
MAACKTKRGPRERLWNAQGGKCYYCGVETYLPAPGSSNGAGGLNGRFTLRLATLDHIIPRAKGGAFAPTKNCVVACRRCNNERGTKDARLFMLEKQGAL